MTRREWLACRDADGKGPNALADLRIHNVFQVTRDMDRAVAFYRDVLGLDVKFQDGGKWCQLTAGDTKLALSSPEEATPAENGSVVVFQVDDLDAARAQLEAAGTEIEAVRDMGNHGRILACRDPDGTILQLYEAAPKI